ncbi:Ig-like domain-containing protein [Christiangramia sp. SM2212]|uniref:Ig-like domain-containing protein n=1 Tax=Christiangramia sediminicola TaxID=3073267 RepID=A0ABU1EU27_9FLAO|nr:Ig-like domain-containing protein [Christiangramia sp. SM2212]MDR5591905.1 Ig-like domain-containing protein [Christiangramia sp. SM2212]
MNFTIRILSLLIISILFVGCNNDDDSLDTLSVYSASINGTGLDESPANVPLSGSIEIAFSHILNAEALEQAISFSDAQGEANYTTTLGNAGSKVVLNYSGLNPASTYTVSIDQGALGDNGEQFNTGFSGNFTTTEEVEETKTPCITASADCMQSIEIQEGAEFEFYSSYDIISDSDFIWENIEEVVFVIHGQNRDADEYFRYMTNAVGDISKLENTLVIAPYFKDEANAADGELYWDSNWREGAISANSGIDISSFTVLDNIVEYLADTEKFPALTEIKFAGHSSGAALVQHYGIVNTAESMYSEYQFQYIVANNQYFYYPDGRRYDESTNEFYTPTDCTGYNFWPYGYETAPAYVDGMTQDDLLQQQISRNTIYLLGTDDTNTEGTLNTTDCAATLLGSNRLERGRNIFNFFETFYPDNNQEKIEVPNIGHDGNAMFNSEEFKEVLNRD